MAAVRRGLVVTRRLREETPPSTRQRRSNKSERKEAGDHFSALGEGCVWGGGLLLKRRCQTLARGLNST